ncbi:MAG: AMP-binding protein [Rubrivivax sp.]|nr:AMP-binding protein [Rubrivivax sp.]
MQTFPSFEPAFPRSEWVLHRVLERQAAQRADKPFLQWTDANAPMSFGEVNREVNRRAHGFLQLGLRRRDVVVLFMANSLDYILTWFALNKIGAVEAPINTAYLGKFLEHQVNICGASTLIADAELLPHVRASRANIPAVTTVVVRQSAGAGAVPVDLPGCRLVDLADIRSRNDADPGVPVRPADTAAIMFTSGTTGLSKGVLMPHAQLYMFSQIDCEAMQLAQDDVYVTGLPFFHANAQLMTIYPCLIAGARCVLYEKFSASQWVERLHATGATVTNSLGVMLPFVHAQPPGPRDSGHRLRRILSAPTPYGILDDFKRRFGVHEFAEGFGQTEICCPIMTPLGRGVARPPGAAGLLLDQWFDVRIVDPETDEELPTGEIGELVVRPQVPWIINAGYVNMPVETHRAWRNLWFHTGDAVRRDADGWYYFVDRLKDALRRRGENISSYEVEAPIREHPAVAEVAVVAVPSELPGGEDEVKACVVLNQGAALAPEALIAWCEGRIPAFAIPRYIEFLTQFPKTPSEKVQKNILRAAGITAATWDRNGPPTTRPYRKLST